MFFCHQFDTYHVNKIERLAHEISECVGVVEVHGFNQILHQTTLSRFPFLFIANQGAPHAFGNHPDLPLFPVLPDPMRNVEQDSLKCKINRILEKRMCDLGVNFGNRVQFVPFSITFTWKNRTNGTHW